MSASAGSDVLYLNLLGADHVILNSNEAISDLLDKRSALYSDRVRGFEPIILQHPNSVGFQPRVPMIELWVMVVPHFYLVLTGLPPGWAYTRGLSHLRNTATDGGPAVGYSTSS